MVVLAQEQKQFKSTAEWKLAMQEKLKPPDIVLQSYGGERLNVPAQLEVIISQGEHTVMGTVLAQKDSSIGPLVIYGDI